jgi:non-specific serine/threonine protein kinase
MATPLDQPTPYAFLSYASADRERALVVADLLEGRDISVWIDRKSIAGGTSWSAEIVEGIKGCAVLVVLVSVAAIQSRNVAQEIQLGWEHDRKILPLRLEPASLPGAVEYALAGRQWVEVLKRREADWLDEAVRALARLGLEPSRKTAPASSPPAPPAEVPPPTESTQAEARSNLPVSLTSFVGRQDELTTVGQGIRENRLVTLTGTGGCGKTRLALEVARRALDRFGDGVWLVELAPLSDPSLVAPTTLGVLGRPEVPGEAPIATLVSYLKNRALLLVLDNCEHLIEACARLCETVLRVCPEVRILATSREMLGLAGELAWRIPSLPVPDPDGPFTPQALVSYAAIELFVERARAVRPAFRLSESNTAALAQIVRRLDGIPLAIELAATRVRGLSPDEILARLDDRFRLLTGGSRTALRRQQTLRALIDWSYDLLAAEEQALLRHVSVFAGSFSLDAAETVCSVGLTAVLDVLFQHVDKSLVVAEEQEEGTRYHLLETIRQYAGEKLVDLGEASELRERHRAYFLDLAERAHLHLMAKDQKAWFGRLEQEIDNLRSALDWSETAPEVDLHLRLAGALGRFWRMTDRNREAWVRLNAALGREGWTDLRARALALDTAGETARLLERRREALRLLEASIACARQAGDLNLLAVSLRHGAWVAWGLGEPQHERYLDEAITTARQAGNQWELAYGLVMRGTRLGFSGALSEGRREILEGLRVAEVVGESTILAAAFSYLSQLAIRVGDAAEAEHDLEAYQQAVQSYGSRSIADIWLPLLRGDVARLRGDNAAARIAYVEAMRIAQQSEALQVPAWVLDSWAAYCLGLGDARQAALIVGALDSFLRRSEIEMRIGHGAWFDPTIGVKARQSLGEEGYQAAYAEGQRLGLEQMLERALASATADNSPSPQS